MRAGPALAVIGVLLLTACGGGGGGTSSAGTAAATTAAATTQQPDARAAFRDELRAQRQAVVVRVNQSLYPGFGLDASAAKGFAAPDALASNEVAGIERRLRALEAPGGDAAYAGMRDGMADFAAANAAFATALASRVGAADDATWRVGVYCDSLQDVAAWVFAMQAAEQRLKTNGWYGTTDDFAANWRVENAALLATLGECATAGLRVLADPKLTPAVAGRTAEHGYAAMRAASSAMRGQATDVDPATQAAWDRLDQLAGAGIDLSRAVQAKGDVAAATSRYEARAAAAEAALQSASRG
jgi:hypothetical protein